MRTVELKEVEVLYCDICNSEVKHFKKCKDCRRDICYKCEYQGSGYCKECWDKEYIIANVKNIVDDEDKGYDSRTYIHRYLEYDSQKWNDMLIKYSNKKVKITFEEVN